MDSHTIVLAHGVLGFGNLFGLPAFVSYFNGVAAHLRRQGHTVVEPQVNPVGTVRQRGDQLGAVILELAADERVHVIAHSMGGLDARHALAHVAGVADAVATLVTVGTPHRRSPTPSPTAPTRCSGTCRPSSSSSSNRTPGRCTT